VPSVEVKTPGAGRSLAPPKRAFGDTKGHKARRVTQGIGEGQGAPNDPETGHWQSERLIVPRARSREPLAGKVGNPGPEGPTAGKETPGITGI